jgi:copper resistance protein B
LSLTPDLEANFYSETDTATNTGSGLSDLDIGLRLRYRVVEGVSPYAGITWKGNFATTADIMESKGEDTGDLRWLLGVTAWF